MANPVSNNSYSKAKKILTRLFKIAQVSHLALSGGEPLLAQRFLEIVLFCRMKHKNITIISNGNAGNSEYYKQLVDLGVSLFEFPLHSFDPQTHDYLTRVEGSWDKAVQSLKQVLALKGRVVCVIVLTKANHKQIKKTLLFIKDLGIKQIMINRFNIGGSGIKEKDNLLLSHAELNKAYKQADKIAVDKALKLSANVCTPFCVINPEHYPHIRMGSCSTDISHLPLTLDIGGNMRLCNHSPVVVGNIFSHTIEQIFNSQYVGSWQNTVPDYCLDCVHYKKCLGGCRAASEQLGLSLKHVDPLVSWKK